MSALWDSVSQPFIHEETPEITFTSRGTPTCALAHSPEKLMARCLSAGTTKAALWKYEINTTTIQLNTALNTEGPQQKGSLLDVEITPVLQIQKQKLPQHDAGHMEVFTIFQNFYLFIPRFFSVT